MIGLNRSEVMIAKLKIIPGGLHDNAAVAQLTSTFQRDYAAATYF
jgi:hypothetical protein